MTKEEYQDRIKQIDAKHKKMKTDLAIEYAKSNNPYKVGDIVEDHIGKIRIERICISKIIIDYPCCTYYGVELKKDGTPCKRQTNRGIHQSNILKENNNEEDNV